MKITTPAGTLVVNDDTEISLTLTNPMFEEQGSHSLPFSVPWCSYNLGLLGNPQRVSKANFTKTPIPCTIASNGFSKKGNLYISELMEGSEIELYFDTDNGSFWSWAKKHNLKDVGTIPDRAFDWAEELDFYTSNVWPAAEMAFFPIVNKINGFKQTKQDSYEGWFNEFPSAVNADDYCSYKAVLSTFQLINHPLVLLSKDKNFIYPVTGFLYMREVLNWVLNTYGVMWGDCDFDDVEELNTMVIINAHVNAFRDDQTHYSELLPEGSVLDFITLLEDILSCVFFFDEKERTISVKFWKNLLSGNDRIAAKGTITNASTLDNGKNLTIKHKVFKNHYSDTQDFWGESFIESLDNFYEYNNPVFSSDDYLFGSTPPLPLDFYPRRIQFNKSLQCYFQYYWERTKRNSSDWFDYFCKAFHSLFYDRVLDYGKTESVTIEPEMVHGSMVYYHGYQFFQDPFTSPIQYYNRYFVWKLVLPFFEIDQKPKYEEIAGVKIVSLERSPKTSLAFYRGLHKYKIGSEHHHLELNTWKPNSNPVNFYGIEFFDMPWGSVDVYNMLGERMDGNLFYTPGLFKSDIALNWNRDYGLYQFIKEYADFIGNGHFEFELTNHDFKLPPAFNKEYLVDGVGFYVHSVDLTITSNGFRINEIKAKSTKKLLIESV